MESDEYEYADDEVMDWFVDLPADAKQQVSESCLTSCQLRTGGMESDEDDNMLMHILYAPFSVPEIFSIFCPCCWAFRQYFFAR